MSLVGMKPPPYSEIARHLAGAMLAGESTPEAIAGRWQYMVGQEAPWATALAVRAIEAFSGRPRPLVTDLAKFLLTDASLRRACRRIRIVHRITGPVPMQPVIAARAWRVPPLESAGDLAAWLALDPGELDWFADLRGLERLVAEPLRHYRYRFEPKRHGGERLLEAPKPRLKRIQQRLLHELLHQVPAHAAAHGFVPGRSILTFTQPHAGQDVVLRMDLEDFFPSIRRARIAAAFRTMGYPETVASLLSGLSTNIASNAVLRGHSEARRHYAQPHLPQGAPTSPALANLCAYRLDARLTGLARAAGVIYSRYADDLAFSGGEAFRRSVEAFSARAAAIVAEEGFTVNFHKTRVMTQGHRQRLAGLVTNAHPNIPRPEFDRLKAILTNCLRHGPESQNRDRHPEWRAHLEGRVGFCEMVNPAKASRLRRLLEAIDWNSAVP